MNYLDNQPGFVYVESRLLTAIFLLFGLKISKNGNGSIFYDFDYEVKRDLIGWNFTLDRNDPCPCGSGKKHKKCCIEKTKVIKEISS